MGLFDTLKKKKPNGKKITDKGIRKFVNLHFDELSEVRNLGYSWKQIVDTIQEHICLKSDNLQHSLQCAFYRVKREIKGA